MSFTGLSFVYYFLPTALILYIITPDVLKNGVLLLISLFFYAWGEPLCVMLLILSAAINFCGGLCIGKYRKKYIPAVFILLNLLPLVIFKYAAFFCSAFSSIAGLNIAVPRFPLPVGISFYTFRAISYIADVWSEKTAVQKNPVSLGLYLAFFPQLTAGPINKYKEFAGQLKERIFSEDKFIDGFCRFCCGLAKKLLIADNIAQIWKSVSASGEISAPSAWLGAFAYTLQIYYDFSGYSDMAIGLSGMFGFTSCENFNYPYLAETVSDFWCRWHISLGSWFREYVYIPLGGNRINAENYPTSKIPRFRAAARHMFNIFAVWALTGLWHGANYTFVVWGLYYAVLLVAEKYCLKKINIPRFIGTTVTFVLVMFGWVIFASPDLNSAAAYISKMFGFGAAAKDFSYLYLLYSYRYILPLAIAGIFPLPVKYFRKTAGKNYFSKILLSVIMLAVCTAYLMDNTLSTFIYFKF